LPRWNPNGKELFYVVPGDGTLTAVSIIPLGTSIQVGAPTVLFNLRGPMNAVSRAGRFLSFSENAFAAARGGRSTAATPDHIVVIHNFAGAVRGGTN